MSNDNSINHKKYDSVFKIVFNDRNELLTLYNALADTHHTDPNEIIINTLDDAVFIGIKNDLSFLIDSYINLYEQQSTMNPNIPLRGLYYLTDLYKTIYNGEMLHHSTAIKLFTPRIIVFYNGSESKFEQRELHLSKMFTNPQASPDLELIVHVININPEYNHELLSKCQKLKEYSVFSNNIRNALSETRGTSSEKRTQIVLDAIDSCIKNNILADILQKERMRVMNSVLAEFDATKFEKYVKEVSYEEGYNTGLETGFNKAFIAMYLKKNITLESALEETHLTPEQFDQALAEYKASQSK